MSAFNITQKVNEDFDANAFGEKLRKLTPKNTTGRRFKVFISHSSKDTAIACELRNLLISIPEMDVILDVCSFEVGEWLPKRIVEEIKGSDCFVVFLIKNAEKSVWVNQKIGVAINADIKIIPIVEKGVRLGLLEDRKYTSLGLEAIMEAVSTICDYPAKYKKWEVKNAKERIPWFDIEPK